MCLALAMSALDDTVVNLALPSLQSQLSLSVTELQWMVNAYLLPIACLVLPAGTLGDRYGRKRVFTAGLAIFIVASALVGLSLNGQIAIAGRLLQGIGAAAILPTSLAILSEAYPNPKARAKAIGIWSGVSGLALIIGPALGGILVDTFGWRSIFFLNIPLGALTLWLTHKSVSTRRQHRFSRLSLKLLRQRSLITVVVTNALLFFTLVSLLFLFSLFLQQVQGYSAIETGLRFLPLNIAFILASLLSGHLRAANGAGRALQALSSQASASSHSLKSSPTFSIATLSGG